MSTSHNEVSIINDAKYFRFFINESIFKNSSVNTEYNCVMSDGSNSFRMWVQTNAMYSRILARVDMSVFGR